MFHFSHLCMTWKPSQGEEDVEKQSDLSASLMGLLRSGQTCRNESQSINHPVVFLFVTPWTAACQAPLSMEFSRQEYWSRLPFPSPGDLPDPGIKTRSPIMQTDSLPSNRGGQTGQIRVVTWLKLSQACSLGFFLVSLCLWK